jgi:mannose-6-phosphate isomerase-like protein (cupin superfamily)
MLQSCRTGALAIVVASLSCTLSCVSPGPAAQRTAARPYYVNILEAARANDAYRRVLHTGPLTQTVVMSIPPGGDIGEESHKRVEQTLLCVEGSGTTVINGVAAPFRPGDLVVVPPGSVHDFINTGDAPLKIYTFYAPPNHLPGRVQLTKAAAEADEADNAFGRAVEEGRIPEL